MSNRTNNEPALQAFLNWAHFAGWSQSRLADEAMTSRPHLNQVLHGVRPGPHTWRRVVRVLPREGLSLLQQCASWNIHAEAALKIRNEHELLAALGAKCREPELIEQH